jgi:hypothetical protein
VRAVFSWSYRALHPDAARMLRLLGLHPGPHLTVPAAASLGGVPVKTAGKLLDELVGANLVIEQVPGRFALHDLMREYAAELVSADEAEADRDRAVRRLLDHYLHNGYAAVNVIDPLLTGEGPGAALPEVAMEELADHDAALNWITAEQEVLLSILDWAAAAGFDRQVWQLVGSSSRTSCGRGTRRSASVVWRRRSRPVNGSANPSCKPGRTGGWGTCT